MAGDIAAVGAECSLATVTGDDSEADRVSELLGATSTKGQQIRLPGIQTVTRLRYFVPDEGGGRLRLHLRVDKDPDSNLSYARIEQEIRAPGFLEWWEEEAERSDAVLFSDTDKGFLSRRVLVALNERILRASARRVARGASPVAVVVDPKREWDKYVGLRVDVLKPNDVEAAGAAGLTRLDWSVDANLVALAGTIGEKYGTLFPNIVITLGEHGAAMIAVEGRRARVVRFPAIPSRVPATGFAMHCGDMFASALALSLCVDPRLVPAIPFATYVASLQVSKPVGQKITASDLTDPLNLQHLRDSIFPARTWVEVDLNSR